MKYIFGLFILVFLSACQLPTTSQPLVTSGEKRETLQTVYFTDTQNGFAIDFPENWKNYRVNTMTGHAPEIQLPTKDAYWKDGYAPVFSILAISQSEWDISLQKCDVLRKKSSYTLEDLGNAGWCDGMNFYKIGVASGKTIGIMMPQESSSDIDQYYQSMSGSVQTATYNTGFIDYLKNHFHSIEG